jgi:hypothetical protein
MEPLDLRLRPPRSPRQQLAGLVFTARVIDKIRASLPGGELNGYFTDIGLSVAWAHYSGIDLNELRRVVESSESEAHVEAWIAERCSHVDKDRFNAKMEGLEAARVPEAWRQAFDSAYPEDLRARFTLLFDLVEADDARASR